MLVVLATIGDVSAASAHGETPDAEPHLTGIDCPDPVLAGPSDLTAGADFTCAMLTVPRDHDDPNGPQLQLFTIGLPSTSETPALEPVIFLAGGPGQAGYPQLAQFSTESPEHTASFAQLRDTHDVILIDQRGTGFSQPSLACPDDEDLDCDDKSTYAGIDLTAFTTRQNAADIDVLRRALGAESVNLVGTSYGSWLALAVLRDFPDTVRGVVLNSPVPPQGNLFAGQLIAFQTALDASMSGCERDPECVAAYPDLDLELVQVIAELNAEPWIVTFEDPGSGRTAEVPIDGDTLMFVIYQMHFHGQFIPFVAPLIASAAAGSDHVLVELLPEVLQASASVSSIGFRYSVLCQDETSFTSEAEVFAFAKSADVSDLVIEHGSLSTLTGIFDVCARWDLPASSSIENEPVISDAPTLIVTGTYDPITPTSYGEDTMATLPNATLVESGIAGHDPLSTSGGCGVDVMHSFLIDPAAVLDTTCLTDVRPDFSPE